MQLQPKRARRCVLSVPGSSEKMMAKAAAIEVDQVLLDLEDAVAPNAKEAAARAQSRCMHSTLWTWCKLKYPLRAHQRRPDHNGVTTTSLRSSLAAGARLGHHHADQNQKCAADVQFLHRLLLDQLELKLGLSQAHRH